MPRNNYIVLLLISAGISVIAGLFVYYPIADGDIFWHLAAGKEIVQNRWFLFTDPFSYTTSGIQWIDLHWLFQLISFVIYSLSGYYGLLIVKSIVVGTAVFILIHPSKSYFSVIALGIIVIFAVFQCRYLIPLRPGIFTLLYMSLFIKFTESFFKTIKLQTLIILGCIQIAWVNTQGLFMLGPVIYCSYIAGFIVSSFLKSKGKEFSGDFNESRNRKYLILCGLLLICVVSIINPYGLSGLLFPLKLFSRITPGEKNIFSNVIDENMPLLKMIGTEYQFYVVTFIILCSITILGCIISRCKVKISHLFLVSGFILLAFMAQRNIILFVFALIPLLKGIFDEISFSLLLRFTRVVIAGVGLLFLVFTGVAGAGHIAMNRSVHGPVAPFCHPVKSTAYLKTHDIQGQLFNADRYGGYILWETFPKNKVYIDTRLTMRDRYFFVNYLALLDSPECIDSVATKYNITAVVIPAAIPRYFPMLRYLYRSKKWSVAVADGSECLFVKKSVLGDTEKDFTGDNLIKSSIESVRKDPMLNSFETRDEAQARFESFLKVIGVR